MILGLHGFAQSGKDTMAKFLIDSFGFQRIAFADVLRESIYRLNPVVGFINGELITVRQVVDDIGWENAKVNYSEVRRLLQVIGTEVGRELIDENIWVHLALRNVTPDQDIVITDVRFPNEVEAVSTLKGLNIKIRRPNVGPINTHASDAGLPEDMFDFVIDNDGSLEDFEKKVLFAFSQFKAKTLFKDAPPKYDDFQPQTQNA